MKKSITRRDFLNGAAVTLAAGAVFRPQDLLAGEGSAVAESPIGKDYYPPALTGMRGSHEGSFEVAHALAWRGEKPTEYAALDEAYDLVIVGGGLSGLASAYCMSFGGTLVKDQDVNEKPSGVGVYKRKDAPAPATCPLP